MRGWVCLVCVHSVPTITPHHTIKHHQTPQQDAVECGVNAVELDNQDQYYVGYGGFPNAAGAMELDAAVMEGTRRCVRALVGID